jgi:hypothetical protein
MAGEAKLPPQGGTPREVALAVNQALDGKLACVGTITTTGSMTQVVANPLVSADSAIFIMPTTTVSRDATVAASNGQITITFQANPGTQAITYIVIG